MRGDGGVMPRKPLIVRRYRTPSIVKSNMIRPRGATDTPPVNHLVPKAHAPVIGRKHPRNYFNLARTVEWEKDLMHIYVRR
jgi:hypothetical protein